MFSASLLCYESDTLALKWLENQNSENTCTLLTPGRSVMIAALLKFIGAVGQSDIFYECPTKNVRVQDQISNRKYKNIHLVYEKKQNTSDHKGQQLGFRPKQNISLFKLSCQNKIGSIGRKIFLFYFLFL